MPQIQHTSGPVCLTPGTITALRPATAGQITGGVWAERRRVNREVSIPVRMSGSSSSIGDTSCIAPAI
jgi:hypothetical protein